MKERVLYLDIDDTLIRWTNDENGIAAPNAAKFVMWALEHFEVRWLTMWCPIGTLEEHRAEDLSIRFNRKISKETFMGITNPNSFFAAGDMYKTNGIDLDDVRPWVWVEDEILPYEVEVLRADKTLQHFHQCNVSEDPHRLIEVAKELSKKFNIPLDLNGWTTP